jgi:hypothetical protein
MAISFERTRSFAFAGLVRPPEAGKPRAGLSPSCGTIRESGLCSPPRRTEEGKAGRASAEFRSIYPVPLRGTAGSSIILEQLRDGKLVKSIHPKIGGRLRLAHEQNQQISITTEIIRYDESVDVRGIETTLEGNGKVG